MATRRRQSRWPLEESLPRQGLLLPRGQREIRPRRLRRGVGRVGGPEGQDRPAAPRKHQGEYEAAIEVWEQVLAWSNRYGERQVAAVAYEKLELLRKRLLIPALEPLARDDTFDAVLDVPTIPLDDLLANPPTAAEIAKSQTSPGPDLANLTPEDRARLGAGIDGSPSRIAREIWQDRLEVQQRKAASEDDSLRAHIERYLAQKENQASAGEVSVGRVVWTTTPSDVVSRTGWAKTQRSGHRR